MKDARGEVLYVGKAQSLRSRVRSYWQKQAPSARGGYHQIREAIDRVVDLEVTEVDSVSEALLLEANLIKRFKPRFNVRLKDDKSYPYIKVTLGDDFPRDRAHPQAAQRRLPLLRAVRVRELRGRGDEPGPAAVPVPDLHHRHPGGGAGPRAALPPVPHQALPGPVHRGDLDAPPTGATSPRWSCSSRATPTRCSRGCATRCTSPPRASSTRRRRSSGTRSGPSSGRWRARRWPPSPARSWTSWRWRARTTRPRSSCSSSATARCWAGTCSSSRPITTSPDDEVLGQFLLQYYARATSVPREVLVPRSVTDTADLEAFLAVRRGGSRCASGRPSAARSAS